MDMNDMGMGALGEKLVKRFFRRVDDCVWDLMTGKLGVRTKDGIATLDGVGDEAQINVNLFEQFGMPLPAFAQSTPVDAIKEGDIVYNDRKMLGWVIKRPEPVTWAFKILKVDGSRTEWRPPKVNSIGIDLSGAMVLRSLINTLPTGGLGTMQSMLLPMMMMGGGSFGDLEDMLPAMLMMQCGGMPGMPGLPGMPGAEAAPAAKGKKGAAPAVPVAAVNPMAGMMQTMLMMKMMGGMGRKGGGGKPGANWFDQKQEE